MDFNTIDSNFRAFGSAHAFSICCVSNMSLAKWGSKLFHVKYAKRCRKFVRWLIHGEVDPQHQPNHIFAVQFLHAVFAMTIDYNLYRMTWQWLSTHIYSSSVFCYTLTHIYLCLRDAQSFCSTWLLVFHFLSWWSLSISQNSKLPTTIWNSFSRVTEPFHFRLARNCCAYTHFLPIGIERNHLLLDIWRCVVCTWFSWHFLVWQDNLWYEQWWGVVGWVPENTTHFLLRGRRRRRRLHLLAQQLEIPNNFDTSTNGNHKYNCPWLLKIWCPGNVAAIICRKFNSFRMSSFIGHFGKQKLNL